MNDEEISNRKGLSRELAFGESELNTPVKMVSE